MSGHHRRQLYAVLRGCDRGEAILGAANLLALFCQEGGVTTTTGLLPFKPFTVARRRAYNKVAFRVGEIRLRGQIYRHVHGVTQIVHTVRGREAFAPLLPYFPTPFDIALRVALASHFLIAPSK